jgi:ferredoxin
MNNWTTAVFSPTGGTSKIAAAIAGARMGTRIDLCTPVEPQEIPAGAPLLAVVPVYGGRIPAIAAQRLLALQGSGNPAIAVVVYGNRAYEDALLELKNVLTEAGHQVIAAAAFIAEHSIVRSIAAGRPDAEDEAICRQFAADVMAKADDAASVQVPGSNPYKELKPSAFHPAANKNCVKCGICAEQCPVGAIPLDDPSETNNDLCINCMRCVEGCPMNSRALPDAFVTMITQMLNQNAAGYKKPVVFL